MLGKTREFSGRNAIGGNFHFEAERLTFRTRHKSRPPTPLSRLL